MKETYKYKKFAAFRERPGDNRRYLPKVPSGGGYAVMSGLPRFASSCTSALLCPRRPFFNASAKISGPRLVGYARESHRIRWMWQQLTYEFPARSINPCTAQTQSVTVHADLACVFVCISYFSDLVYFECLMRRNCLSLWYHFCVCVFCLSLVFMSSLWCV